MLKRFVLKTTPRILKWLNVEVVVKDHNVYDASRNYVFVNLNQESLIGTLGIALAFPLQLLDQIFYLANARFAYLMPLWGWSVAANAVVVWKSFRSSRSSALSKCIARVSSGESLYMSIEGQRSRDGGLMPYREGAAKIALAAKKTPIVGIVMHGSFDLNPYGSFFVKPGTITYEVLPVLYIDTYDVKDSKVVTELLRKSALKCIEDYRKNKLS